MFISKFKLFLWRKITIKKKMGMIWIMGCSFISCICKQQNACKCYLFFLFYEKMLLWQASIATSPHVFVIATCIRSVLIIYLLVSCNKQFFSWTHRSRHLSCFYTFYSLHTSGYPVCVKTWEVSRPLRSREKLLITTYTKR